MFYLFPESWKYIGFGRTKRFVGLRGSQYCRCYCCATERLTKVFLSNSLSVYYILSIYSSISCNLWLRTTSSILGLQRRFYFKLNILFVTRHFSTDSLAYRQVLNKNHKSTIYYKTSLFEIIASWWGRLLFWTISFWQICSQKIAPSFPFQIREKLIENGAFKI